MVVATRPDQSVRVYYFHPLLSGPLSDWQSWFDHAAELGFSDVLMAPPFLPGRAGDPLLTADHDRFHPALGGTAEQGLLTASRAARQAGLRLLLDVVLDRMAVEHPLVARHADQFQSKAVLADPRVPPDSRHEVQLRPEANGPVLDWWNERLHAWIDMGIDGFRVDATHRVPLHCLHSLLDRARDHRPQTLFVAWFLGATAAEADRLAGCDFDLAASSSWAWDFRRDWLNEDARRCAAVGRVLAMPELPFRPGTQACAGERLRALAFAAAYGQAWLMPMGFEFGASWIPARQPGQAGALRDTPVHDLRQAVRDANRVSAELTPFRPGQVVSPPHAPVAAIRRNGAAEARLMLANPSLDQPVRPPAATLLAELDGDAAALPDCLPPAAVMLRPLLAPAPVLLPRRGARQAAAAAQAPRIAIEAISPTVEGGRFAARRDLGYPVAIEADIFADGHETLAAQLLWRPLDQTGWNDSPMLPVGNDRWRAAFPAMRPGRHVFCIEAWIDVFASYRVELSKKLAAGQVGAVELQEGRALVEQAARRGKRPALQPWAARLAGESDEILAATLLDDDLTAEMALADARPFAVRTDPLPVEVERRAAHFASWYELFPRSQSGDANRHGTFADVVPRLPAIRAMGFDVLYFPPIHPIGRTNRKGRNNAPRAQEGDPGSPYAIGAQDGGHDAVHAELGTLEDFRKLCAEAAQYGLEVALDFAIQCSPDHPWLKQHPEWFSWRADGSLRYAENPPKKYEDIVNVDFYAERAVPALWLALRDAVQFWVENGVRIFRVDNPHTKPLPFWEWMIADIRGRWPDVVFLAEAFTRPRMMYRLAKVGFSQSYTYFTWRDTAAELREYLTELTVGPPRDFFRPHFFVNTPDINPFFLQRSGRAGFLIRAALAALTAGLWGIYSGFELCEATALPGREEYADSEKYAQRVWDWNRPGNIIAEIAQLNRIRRDNPALHTHLNFLSLPCSHPDVLCFMKATDDFSNILLIAILTTVATPAAFQMNVPPEAVGLAKPGRLLAEDLLQDVEFALDTGAVDSRLDPAGQPFLVWRLRPETPRP